MSSIELPFLKKYGKEIGKSADEGDEDAKKIIYWYGRSEKSFNRCEVAALALDLALDWYGNPRVARAYERLIKKIKKEIPR